MFSKGLETKLSYCVLFSIKIVEEVKDLNGPYEKAFLKIGGIMEDSGWLLEQVGEEPGACMEMVSNIDMLYFVCPFVS